MMACRLTLLVAVVCVGSVCSSGQTDVISKLLLPQDYGIKLCGREFIRAVIFTCGGSRWRRSTDQEFESLQWTAQNDVTEEDNQRSSAALTDPRAPFQSSPSSSSLANLLVIFSAFGERQPEQQQNQVLSEPQFLENPQITKFSREEVAGSPVENWPVSNRKKRNFSRGVAGMCCSQGCTKNDIGRLC